MDLTPELLRNVEFADARKGGYVHDDVDHFLDMAADALAEQQQQRQVLEARLRAAETRLANTPTTVAAEPSDTEETLRRTLVLAQRTADAAIEEAKAEAAKRIAIAEADANKIVRDAEEAVERDVGAKRDQLRSEIAALEVERTGLHDRISRLRSYVESERSRLKAQLESVARAIEQEDFEVEPANTIDEVPLVDTPSSAVATSVSAPTDEPATREDTQAVSTRAEVRLESAPEVTPAASENDLSQLPPPPEEESLSETGSNTNNRHDRNLDDAGPPTEATPVIVAGSGAGAPHLDELRRAVSQDEDAFDQDDAAMAAFFDQDEGGDEDKRRFGRRR